jgi:peptidoglycan-associated lipoprotein
MKHFTLVSLLFMFFCGPLLMSAQEKGSSTEDPQSDSEKKSKPLQRADDYFEAREFYFAIEAYKKANSKAKGRNERAEIAVKTAECYRYMGDWKNAEAAYKRAFKMNSDAKSLFMQAEMLKNLGEYEDAIVEYTNYKKLAPTDKRADQAIDICRKSIEWIQNPSRYQVNNMKDFNSRESEFGTAYGGRPNTFTEVYFTSNREGSAGKGEDGWTGQGFTDIYVTEAERMKKKKKPKRGATVTEAEQMNWSTPIPVSEILNSKFHEGGLTFDSRRKTMYFTRCLKEKNQKLGCQIYTSEKRGKDWSEPEMLVLAPDTSSSIGHPSLSADDKFLYFSSDMEGALGEKDIWVTTFNRREKKWEKATNLGNKINTKGSELYPFIHDDGYLYFSSDGLPGMGGLDVFRVSIDPETGLPNGEVENLQYPINTHSDDFSIIFEEGGVSERGYLSSNRKGGRGGDDIYSVYLVPLKFQIDGTLTSSKDGKPISFASVRLDGTDGTSVVVSTDKDGYYKFDKNDLNPETNYKLNYEKQKFLTNTSDATTVGVPFAGFEYVPSENIYLHNINIRMKLEPIEEPIVLPNVFFDLAKANLRDESKQALDSVFYILQNNPTIVIELRSHTDYRDTDAKNDELSQRRADSCVAYLIGKGIPADRLVAVGKGEREPFKIPADYTGYGKEHFKAGKSLTENFIKSLSSDKQEIANQINRRTDFKVLRDDYVPAAGTVVETTEDGGTPTPKKGGPGVVYTMERGDNLGKVAQKFNINIRELKALNNGLVGVRLVPGMKLKVTEGGDYTAFDAEHHYVERGDNLSKIAKQHGLKKDELSDLNDGIADKDVMPGMYLRIK